jgi:polysaccharide pyruvyl transferase WcaK-like protein
MTIGLLDHMGYGNLGDAATQEALIANIRLRVPEAQIVGFSLNPVDTEERHGIPSHSITHWHPGLGNPAAATGPGTSDNSIGQFKSLLKKIPILSPSLRWVQNLVRELRHLRRSYLRVKSLDCLVIAGGGQLCELWRGPWSHPYNVFKFSLLTKLARKKLLVVNVGAGPLETRLGKIFIKWSVRLADYVSMRDVESQALIQRLGIQRETFVCPDSAYALNVSRYRNVDTPKAYRPVVGINPIGFCDPRIWPRKDSAVYSRYLDNLAQFLIRLSGQNYELRIFSAERSVDEYAVEDLKDRLRSGLAATDVDKICTPPIATVENLLTEMARFDFVITSKFHGVVFSHLLAKPVLAISYHAKIDDLMRNVGDSQYCLNIESFDSVSLERAFAELTENSSALAIKYRQVATTRADLLNRQFDDLFVPTNLQPRSQRTGATNPRTIPEKPEWQRTSATLEEGKR